MTFRHFRFRSLAEPGPCFPKFQNRQFWRLRAEILHAAQADIPVEIDNYTPPPKFWL